MSLHGLDLNLRFLLSVHDSGKVKIEKNVKRIFGLFSLKESQGMSVDTQKLADEVLPKHLQQLQESSKTMEEIAKYCRESRKKKEYDQVYKQSFDYSRDALTNAAYHVHTVGTQLTRFIILQSEEVDRLAIHVKSLTDVSSYDLPFFNLYPNLFVFIEIGCFKDEYWCHRTFYT